MRLRTQLLIALVGPATLVLGGSLIALDRSTQGALEGALGRRLTSVAEAAVTLSSPRVLMLEPGDDASRTARNVRRKLEELRRATKVARILLIRARDDTVLIDTAEQRRLGDAYVRARFDRFEIDAVRSGDSVASVLFEGDEGRPFKTGYAGLADDRGEVRAYAAVVAAADYTDALERLRGQLALVALVAVLVLSGLALVVARRVSVPLARLADAARAVGSGRLDVAVPTEGPTEARVLGETMDKMARDLEARDQRLQMMLAGIAHEVRNPLGGIELFGGLLQEDLPVDDPRRAHVDRILRELDVLAAVVNDFLEYARERAPEPADVAPRDLLERARELAVAGPTDAGVEVEVEAEPGRLFVDGDRLGRALLNLVRNAVQAAAPSGRVRCRARFRADACEFTVEDSGPGIPEDHRHQIFEPFFTTKQQGTGLGLALVKKAVSDHGGTIAVDDSRLGGARFVVRVPVRMDYAPPG
jgi:signal transduction histidine kinase